MKTSEKLDLLKEIEKRNAESIARFIVNGQAGKTA